MTVPLQVASRADTPIREDSPVRAQLLDELASAFASNRKHLEAKGKPLNVLLVATAIETLFVAGAVIVGAA